VSNQIFIKIKAALKVELKFLIKFLFFSYKDGVAVHCVNSAVAHSSVN